VGIADVSGILDRDRGGGGVSEPVWWERGAKCLFGMLPDSVRQCSFFQHGAETSIWSAIEEALWFSLLNLA
jgi:hypothetical protein